MKLSRIEMVIYVCHRPPSSQTSLLPPSCFHPGLTSHALDTVIPSPTLPANKKQVGILYIWARSGVDVLGVAGHGAR